MVRVDRESRTPFYLQLKEQRRDLVCGTMAEVAPIGSVDHRPVAGGTPGPVTRRLQECFFEIVRGGRPQYAEWLTPVYQAGEEAGGRLLAAACEAPV